MSAVSDILNRKGSKALTQILIFLVSFVLALLVGVSLQRHGQAAVVRALSRRERAPETISAF